MHYNFTATKTRQQKSVVLLLLVLNLFINGVQASSEKSYLINQGASISNTTPVFADYTSGGNHIFTSAKEVYKPVSQHPVLLSEAFATKLMVSTYHCKSDISKSIPFSPPDIIYPFHSFW